jgi:hypothetical protein
VSSGSVVRSSPGAYYRKSWSGTNDPLHKAENAYSCDVKRTTAVYCRFTSKSTGSIEREGFYEPGHADSSPVWSANMDLELLGKVVSGIRGHDFNAGIAGAESHKTLKMITDTASTVYTAWKQTKHGRFGDAARTLGRVAQGNGTRKSKVQPSNSHDVSDAWLSMQYGWLPLLGDVYEGAKFIETKFGPPRTIRQRYTRNVRVPKFDDRAGGWSEYVECSALLSKEIRIYWVEQVGTARSLGLTNPASVAWEVVPFSFVMDWFIPIGDYLDVLGVIPHLNGAQAASTLVKYVHGKPWAPPPCKLYKVPIDLLIPHKGSYCCWTATTPATWTLVSNGSATYHRKLITRYTKGPLTVPKPDFKTISEALSLGHLANAAALIHSITRR